MSDVGYDHPGPFTQRLRPGTEDIDGLNHTNNAVYVRWCEQVAWAHSDSLGLSLADYRSLNRAMAIRRGEYDYLLPTLLDEELELATWLVASDGKLTLTRCFQLIRCATGETVMRGRWELVSRVRQLNVQVIVFYELPFKNVYYKRESCSGFVGFFNLKAAKTRSCVSEKREMPVTGRSA